MKTNTTPIKKKGKAAWKQYSLLYLTFLFCAAFSLPAHAQKSDEAGVFHSVSPLASPHSEWSVPLYGDLPGGIVAPFGNGKPGMVLSSGSAERLARHGRMLCTETWDGYDGAFSAAASVAITDAAWGTRLLFDYRDGANFSAVFLSTQYQRAGVETWMHGRRVYDEISFPVSFNQTYRIQYAVNGTRVSLWIDGVKKMELDVPLRRYGAIGIESYKGATQINQFRLNRDNGGKNNESNCSI